MILEIVAKRTNKRDYYGKEISTEADWCVVFRRYRDWRGGLVCDHVRLWETT